MPSRLDPLAIDPNRCPLCGKSKLEPSDVCGAYAHTIKRCKRGDGRTEFKYGLCWLCFSKDKKGV